MSRRTWRPGGLGELLGVVVSVKGRHCPPPGNLPIRRLATGGGHEGRDVAAVARHLAQAVARR